MGSSRISPSKSVGPGDCRHGEGVYTTTMVPSQGRSKIGANAYGSGQESGEYYVKFRMPAKEADRYDGHTTSGDHMVYRGDLDLSYATKVGRVDKR